MKILSIGIVGSRRRDTEKDKEIIRGALKHFIDKDKNVCIHLVSGGCSRGADKFAEELAKEFKLGISIHYPDKSQMKENTKWEYAKICYERNTKIAEECNMLIALWDGVSGGTYDTMKKVDALKKPVLQL